MLSIVTSSFSSALCGTHVYYTAHRWQNEVLLLQRGSRSHNDEVSFEMLEHAIANAAAFQRLVNIHVHDPESMLLSTT
jgi:hypothetical protein